MKVLIPNPSGSSKDGYELMRLRKSLKGECEIANIPYVTNPLNEYDILHVLNLDQDLLINDAVDNKKPIVVSALMAESDPNGRMCVLTKNGLHLKPKAIKVLNLAKTVITPNEECRDFLVSEGVETPIEVLCSGVNMSRFVAVNDAELDLFRKYFSISKSQKVILCVGQYDNKEESTTMIEIAKRIPEATFVYLGKSKFGNLVEWFINRLLKKSPKNLVFSDLIEDDVYRSAMMNADIYLSLKDIKFDNITMLEAMAAKTRIISLRTENNSKEYQKHIIRCESIDEVVSQIRENLVTKNEKELSSAMDFALTHNLKNTASKIKKIYENLLK